MDFNKFLNAMVVSTYKKGDSSSLANYRPISLLSCSYKIIAALIKNRLLAGLDPWLMQTQYGFRPKKSTSHAIYVAGRLQDIAEKSTSRSTLILLDWEKVFDRVAQEKVIEALKCLLFPNRICNLVASFYQNPQFKVKVGSDNSDWTYQRAGIRQGCPLSPYLFVLVMGVIFSDLKVELCTPRQIGLIDGIYFSEMFFADDTLIFGAGARCINAGARCINVLLHAIERHSEYFGLKLNYDKYR